MNPLRTRTGWRDHAACIGAEQELFFPIGSGTRARQQAEQAKQLCSRCPVRTLCLEWSLRAEVEFGVWGGLDENERRCLRGNRQQVLRPT